MGGTILVDAQVAKYSEVIRFITWEPYKFVDDLINFFKLVIQKYKNKSFKIVGVVTYTVKNLRKGETKRHVR
jgi:hypothetical protein